MVTFVAVHETETSSEGQAWIPSELAPLHVYLQARDGLPPLVSYVGRGMPSAVVGALPAIKAKARGLWGALLDLPPSLKLIHVSFAAGHNVQATAVKVLTFGLSDDGQTVTNALGVEFSLDALLAAS